MTNAKFLSLNYIPIGSTCEIWSTKSLFPKYTVIFPLADDFLNTLNLKREYVYIYIKHIVY